jgi:hypothetical protein
MHKENIITPDKILELANNCISRYKTDIVLTPDRNIFFVKPDYLHNFIQAVLPKINYNFILLTHDSDIPITNDYKQILENPYLIKWFGMNCHILHNKLQPIPIGMANEIWPHGNKDTMIKIVQENNKKENLIYCNFDPNTNLSARTYTLSIIKKFHFIDFETTKLDYENYLRKLSTYKYVISPPGNSVDCHRIWEAIYLGVIPVVLKSIPMAYFKDCPILFLNDWTDLTVDLLEEKYNFIKQKPITKSDYLFYKEQILKLK